MGYIHNTPPNGLEWASNGPEWSAIGLEGLPSGLEMASCNWATVYIQPTSMEDYNCLLKKMWSLSFKSEC